MIAEIVFNFKYAKPLPLVEFFGGVLHFWLFARVDMIE